MISYSRSPSTEARAFGCPHCGAYTSQFWHSTYAKPISGESKTPNIPDDNALHLLVFENENSSGNTEVIAWCNRVLTHEAHITALSKWDMVPAEVDNLHLSKCFNCKRVAVWVHTRMVYPEQKPFDMPTPDMPAEVVRDFEEARSIIQSSPRGAAALLRLCIQKLCILLGEKGKSIDDDIASLVRKGLSPLVQQALDIVRVIGNESVHPGTLDLRDDQDTAAKLLQLVNLIVDQTITAPKAVAALYESLPEAKRAAIEKRDGGRKDG